MADEYRVVSEDIGGGHQVVATFSTAGEAVETAKRKNKEEVARHAKDPDPTFSVPPVKYYAYGPGGKLLEPVGKNSKNS